MFQVADQFAEDPCLVWVSDAAMFLLHDSLGQDLTPGEVVHRDLAELALVNLGRMLAGGRRDLVADRDQSVEPVLTSDIEVVL